MSLWDWNLWWAIFPSSTAKLEYRSSRKKVFANKVILPPPTRPNFLGRSSQSLFSHEYFSLAKNLLRSKHATKGRIEHFESLESTREEEVFASWTLFAVVGLTDPNYLIVLDANWNAKRGVKLSDMMLRMRFRLVFRAIRFRSSVKIHDNFKLKSFAFVNVHRESFQVSISILAPGKTFAVRHFAHFEVKIWFTTLVKIFLGKTSRKGKKSKIHFTSAAFIFPFKSV